MTTIVGFRNDLRLADNTPRVDHRQARLRALAAHADISSRVLTGDRRGC